MLRRIAVTVAQLAAVVAMLGLSPAAEAVEPTIPVRVRIIRGRRSA